MNRVNTVVNKRRIFFIGLGIVTGLATFGAVRILSLPGATPHRTAPPIPQEDINATIAALKPPKRERPLVAIIGINEATETTDYLMPYGILRRADVADMVTLSTGPGPVTLYPALRVEPDATIKDFDTEYPEGADYVIVPAMSRDNDPVALEWIRSQANKAATIIGVCVGARVVAETGLLDGKRATTHWYVLKGMLDRHPSIQYVPDRRLVADQNVVTTTGISASMPMALTLIQAIAGREKAEAVARDLGAKHWDISHNSAAFKMTRPFALTVLRNTLAFWNREQLGIELSPDMDEVSLALAADAWSSTYRSRAITFSGSAEAVMTKNGVRILPDRVATRWPDERLIPIGELPVRFLLGEANSQPPDSSKLRANWQSNQQIALSRGINDAGLFELNFNDERYLPFEGTGAISTWELRMPKASNSIDFDSISDVIINLRYTAYDGGDSFRRQLFDKQSDVEGLQKINGYRLFSARQLAPTGWQAWKSGVQGKLQLSIDKTFFPLNLSDVKFASSPDRTVKPIAIYAWPSQNGNSPLFSLTLQDSELPLKETQENISHGWGFIPSSPDALLGTWQIQLTSGDIANVDDLLLIVPFQGALNWASWLAGM